ncbi:unnamed protein product [Schistosoma rodhaini]|nr:unnamed protein product [Schistosoma rodhaini]
MFFAAPKTYFSSPQREKARELTRWDRFARLKGIQNRKKSRKVWDPVSESWKPRWGKDRIDDVKDKWVLEVPDNADPYEDQFAKLIQAKKERRAKNELQRLRNISRTVKAGQTPPIGVLTESQSSKTELSRGFAIAQNSDASMGRFSAPVDSRKISKNVELNKDVETCEMNLKNGLKYQFDLGIILKYSLPNNNAFRIKTSSIWVIKLIS